MKNLNNLLNENIRFLFFDWGTFFPVDFGAIQKAITLSATSSFVPFFSKSSTSQTTFNMGIWKFRLKMKRILSGKYINFRMME